MVTAIVISTPARGLPRRVIGGEDRAHPMKTGTSHGRDADPAKAVTWSERTKASGALLQRFTSPDYRYAATPTAQGRCRKGRRPPVGRGKMITNRPNASKRR